MKVDIEHKLREFLKVHMPLTEECHVVYLFVEIRKILDHDRNKNKKYPLLRFYADWLVHTQKDKITNEIKTVMERIHKEIREREGKGMIVSGDPKLVSFASMMELRSEVDDFLRFHNLPDDLVVSKNWDSAQRLLAGVLADQPLMRPCQSIRRLSFKPAPGREICCNIEYLNSAGEYVVVNFNRL